MRVEYDRRRRLIVDGLNYIGLPTFEPRGAFYAFPKVSVTAIAREDTEEQIFQAIQAGAAAYFSRKTTPEELTQAIRRLSRGEYIINVLK